MIDPPTLHRFGIDAGTVSFDQLGLVDSTAPNTLSFLDEERFAAQMLANPNIAGVIVTPALSTRLRDDGAACAIIEHEDPRWAYYSLHNELAARNQIDRRSEIASDAVIHPSAFVSAVNVTLGPGSFVGPNVSILRGRIGSRCEFQAGAVIGSEGFEFKRTFRGILPVQHDGDVIIGDDVHVGANTCVDRGFLYRHTVIGTQTKIDNLVHIGHSAHIGKRCLIAACAQIGAVDMEDDVWVGPSVNLLSGQQIGAKAYITVGSVVTKDVPAAARVTGNFAIPHDQFLRNLKRSVQD